QTHANSLHSAGKEKVRPHDNGPVTVLQPSVLVFGTMPELAEIRDRSLSAREPAAPPTPDQAPTYRKTASTRRLSASLTGSPSLPKMLATCFSTPPPEITTPP